jgi:hypothetical protein
VSARSSSDSSFAARAEGSLRAARKPVTQTSVRLTQKVDERDIEPREPIAVVQIGKRQSEGWREHGVASGARCRERRAGLCEFVHQKHAIVTESGDPLKTFSLFANARVRRAG